MNDEFMKIIAEEACKTSLLSTAIAREIVKDREFINDLTAMINKDTLIKHLADNIMFQGAQATKGSLLNDTVRQDYISMKNQVRTEASKIIAAKMIEDGDL